MDKQQKKIWQLLLFLAIICIQQSVQQKNPHYIGNRTTMVHLFEWKFDDIAKECEQFLGPYGYGGLQTSVITECIVIRNSEVKRPWWERYQVMSYKFISRSGNEQQFRNMVRRCNDAGVRVFVDVILNHMTGNNGDNAVGTAGSTAKTGESKYYPGVPYDKSNFHQTCSIKNWNDAYQLRFCELSGLRDLDQSQDYVREKMIDKLNRMVDAGVAGFRFDAAKHMLPSDLKYIYNSVKNLRVDHGFPENARAFITQEVSDFGDPNEPIKREEYIPLGTVTEFRNGVELTKHFGGESEIKYLRTFGTSWGLMKGEDGLVFVDNHDTQRDGYVLTYKKSKPYKMAVAFMLAHPHSKIPRVMSSFAFDNKELGPPMDGNENIISPKINADNSCGNGWVCEHRWRPIYGMVQFKNVVGDDAPLTNWWDNGSNQIAFCRGNRGFIAINKSGNLKQTLQTCLPSGKYCDVITGDLINNKCTGKVVTVDGNGNALIEIYESEDDAVLAIHIQSKF
ncbi:alpha-amylase-related protein-like [Chrysoperla carnea]|uniref:alpha-amylase-related protein-like n=1 Tax=Chrysoperla carnea TaxID=189513 RepID=UPI001D082E7A|nr:alpha-amylase-related protein-like [Chrysoperla carnea]